MWALVFFISIIIILMIIVTISEPARPNKTPEKNKKLVEQFCSEYNFNIDKEISGPSHKIYIDNSHKKLMIKKISLPTIDVYDFDDILGMEVKEDGQCTDGVGRAIVGGALFGGTGAIVGAVTAKQVIKSFKIIIYLNNIQKPQYIFDYYQDIKKDSGLYGELSRFAQEINAVVKVILNNKSETVQETESDKIEAIKKYKELLDIGAISQEEYDNKKAQLLQ